MRYFLQIVLLFVLVPGISRAAELYCYKVQAKILTGCPEVTKPHLKVMPEEEGNALLKKLLETKETVLFSTPSCAAKPGKQEEISALHEVSMERTGEKEILTTGILVRFRCDDANGKILTRFSLVDSELAVDHNEPGHSKKYFERMKFVAVDKPSGSHFHQMRSVEEIVDATVVSGQLIMARSGNRTIFLQVEKVSPSGERMR